MKHSTFISTIACIVFLAMSCTKKTKSSQRQKSKAQIEIDLDKIAESNNSGAALLSTYFKNITPIVLKSEDVLLGVIDKLLADEQYLYIMDATLAEGVFAFDKAGNFIRQYGGTGNAPGEYLKIGDFTINHSERELLVLDRNSQRIIIYNMDTGKYIRSLRLDKTKYESYSIEYYDGRLYADMHAIRETPETNLLREIDSDTGKDINSWFNIVDYNKSDKQNLLTAGKIVGQRVFYNDYSGVPKFKQLLMDEFISLENEDPEISLRVTGENIITKEEIQELQFESRSDFEVKKDYPQVALITAYFEIPGYIFIDYREKRECKPIIYSKDTRQVFAVSEIHNDLVYNRDNERVQPINFLYADSKGAYAYPFNFFHGLAPFLEARDNQGLNSKIAELDEIKGLTEESNPIIFYYEYK